MEKRVLLLTGPPGIGKTTLITKTAIALNAKGYHIGGIISKEIRQNHERLGFELINLTTNEHAWLAHISQKEGPQIGKYKVSIENLDRVATQAISTAIKTCEVIIIDEIGPMELFSEKFKQLTRNALESTKLVVATIHWRTQDNLIHAIRNREDAETISITNDNREALSEKIAEKCSRILEQAQTKLKQP